MRSAYMFDSHFSFPLSKGINLAKTKKITYPHFTIEEKEKKKPKTELVHRHLERMRGTRSYESTDGKILTIKDSAKAESESTIHDINFLEEKCDLYKILPGLFYAFWKDNPDKGFFFISGNKKSVSFDECDLKKGWIRYSRCLKDRKKKKIYTEVATKAFLKIKNPEKNALNLSIKEKKQQKNNENYGKEESNASR
jgi:hypothetical protein